MPKPLNTEALDRALNNINKAAEAAKTASASAVKKKKDENLYTQAARPAENRTPYADAAARRSYFGMGDTAMDADQGRELLYSAQKASEERLARATAQIEEQARQARELREQSRKASEERLKRAREQIEAQARQAQEAQAQREAPKNISYTQEDIDRGNRAYAQRQAQQERASAGFRANAMDMMGAALAAQETPYGAAAEQGRQVMDLYARAAESQRQSKELARAEDWEGREDMIARYRDLQRRVQETETMVGMGFGNPEDYEAQVRELEALRTELERRDTLAGNGARSYSGQDRVGNVLTGTGQNIAAGIVNAGATAGEGYAREEALRENIAPSDYVLQQMARGDLSEWERMRQRTVDQEAIHEQFLPVYQAADSLSENAQRDLQKAKEGLGALGQAGVDIAENMMEMGFDAAVGAVSGGGSLTSMFVRVFGQSAQEARQNGATLEQQLAYGLTSAGIEILTEKIADGVAGIYGAGAADDITEELIRKLAETDTGRSALRLLIAGISEGGEEVISDLLSPIAQAMYRTDEMGNRLTVGQLYGEIDPADVLHSFIMGAAVGWLSSAGGAVTGSNAGPNAELRLRDALEPMARQAAKSAETRAAWEAATGEKLSNNERRAARQMLDYEAERVGSGEAGVLEGLLEKENALAEAEAVERAQEGVQINGENAYQGQENGNDGLRAVGEDGGVQQEVQGGQNAVAGGEGEVRQSLGEGNAEDLREVTPAALGITGGDGSRTMQIRGENSYSEQERAAADMVRKAGLTPTIFTGEMLVNGESVNGWIENGQVYVRSDAVDAQGKPIPPENIAWHETFHDAAENDPGLVERGMSIIRENYDEARVQAMKDDYRETYKNIYDFETMTEDEIQKAIETELVGDAGAKLNRFSGDTETRQQIREAMPQVGESQQAQGRERATGPPKGKATMAGQKARTANSTNLQQAERMETEGRSNEEIRQETGWFRGMDGQWRFEIDDSGAKYYRSGDARFRNDHPEYARYQDLMGQFLTGNLTADELVELQKLEQTWGREQQRLKEMVDSGRATLDMLMDHPALFEAYPELKQARVRFADLNPGTNGQYGRKHNNFTLSNELRNAPESTLIHEIQHAVQAAEGFSGGASVEYWENQERSGKTEGWKSDETKELEQKREELLESMSEEGRAVLSELNRALYSEEADLDRAGELEDELWDGPDGDVYGELLSIEGKLAVSKSSDRKTSAQFNYLNTAGEIEARDTADRRNMTAEERKNTPPDLGDENTVFADGSSFSMAMDGDPRKVTKEDVRNLVENCGYGLYDDDTFVPVRINTPALLITEVQRDTNGGVRIPNLPMAMQVEHVRQVTEESESRDMSGGKRPHQISPDEFVELMERMNTPNEIVLQKNGRYAEIIHYRAKDGNRVVAVIEAGEGRGPKSISPNNMNGFNGGYYNLLVTLYAPDSMDQYYNQVQKTLYKKNGNSQSGSGSEIPSHLNESPFFEDSILQSDENINPQNEEAESGKKDSSAAAQKDSGEQESRATPEQQEAREANSAMADELADGSWSSVEPGKAIDIIPGEGEEAVSSANGLTEEDNRRLDTYINAADLFGPTNAEKEKTATEKAAKFGNDALREFAETMPEDPMDLYAEQNPVTTKAENKYHRGQEKITNEKAGERKTLLQKVSDAWHAFLRSMVNEGDAIHQIGRKTGNRAIDGMYFYAKAATMRAQQWVQKQRTSFDTRTTGKGLNEIFDPIRAKGDRYYQNFQLYLYHMLNVERMSRAFGTELEEAQALVDQLASANPSIAAMTDETLAAKARQYEEGGGLGYLENETQGELIYEYWKAKQELRRAEKARNKPVFDYDLDADESQKIARDLLAANPEFEKLAQEVYDYVDALLQYRVDAGLITQADAENLKKTYPHYVPVMYEISEEGDDKIRKGNVNVSSTVKKAKGGNHRMLPLHYALARQTLAVMRNAGYQQLGTAVLNEFEQNRGIMDRYVSNVEENDAVWDEAMADNDDVNVPYENVISVFRGGKRYDLTLSDDLSFAFKSLQSGKNGPQDLKAAVAANNLFKKLCTAYNPLFLITNPIRDVQDALFYSTDTKRWIRNYPKAIAQISGSGNYWQMYQSLGGVQNSYFDWATGETAGKMGKVEALNLAIEQAPRLAEFMTVLENAKRNNGGEFTQADLMEAFNAAAEVTTNFARGGTMGKWINRNLVPFWNPGVQGLSKAVRTATEAKSFKAWAGLALKAAALGMLPELLNGLLYRDDDEWDVIDDQMKMDYYLFKTSDGVWIKIPKGRMLAALSMPVVGAQEAMRGDDVDWRKLTRSAFGSIAPNNPFESNLLSTAMQAQLSDPDDPGKTWYGGNIESRRLQSYAPGERYDESTDAISKWLGGKLGISPKKINYVIDQYSGVLGDLVLPYLTPKAERGLYLGDSGVAVPFSNAFMSRFTTDTVTSNTISNEYYGLLDELGYNAKDGDKPSAIAERYMNRAGGQVTEFYAKIREIENDPKLTDAEKSKLTRELRKQLNEYEQQVTEDAGKYLEAAQKYMDEHPEYDYSDDDTVDAFVEGYNSQQTSEKYYIDADQARSKMKDEVYREVNREHFGAEYALQTYSKDVYEKAKAAHEESGVSYEDYYDFYFGKRYLFADKDEEGKSIAGSKKEKVVNLIDGMDIPDEQKDELYLSAGYKEDSLEDAPWNNGTGMYTGSVGSSGSKIRVPKGHEATYEKIVNDNMDALTGSAAYKAANTKGQKALVKMLQEYATVQAMRDADPEYSPAGTTHSWTVWADTAAKAGIPLSDAIGYVTELQKFKADYDQYGKAVSGTKKEKVCEYIDGLDLSDEQKDTLYLYVYAKSGLKYTPWHGYKGKRRGGSGGRRGGRSGRRTSSGSAKISSVSARPGRSTGGGIDASKLFGVKSPGKIGGDASRELLEIIDRYYGGDAWAAAMDGGQKAKGRTTIDFKI